MIPLALIYSHIYDLIRAIMVLISRKPSSATSQYFHLPKGKTTPWPQVLSNALLCSLEIYFWNNNQSDLKNKLQQLYQGILQMWTLMEKLNYHFLKQCLKMKSKSSKWSFSLLTFHLETIQTNQNLQSSVGHLLQSVCSQVSGHDGLHFCYVDTEVHSPAVNTFIKHKVHAIDYRIFSVIQCISNFLCVSKLASNFLNGGSRELKLIIGTSKRRSLPWPTTSWVNLKDMNTLL